MNRTKSRFRVFKPCKDTIKFAIMLLIFSYIFDIAEAPTKSSMSLLDRMYIDVNKPDLAYSCKTPKTTLCCSFCVFDKKKGSGTIYTVSYTHLRAHET